MELIDLQNIETRELACNGCTNKCSVLRFKFPNGNISYAGNKCEKVFFSKNSVKTKGFNAFEVKNSILFSTRITQIERINTDNTNKISENLSNPCYPCAKIGIPRILNIYENFPFWKTLFEECGFEVVLSPESDMKLYQSGVGSVMSDNICFPAKLAHGHILALVEQKVDRIFYPIIPKDEKEFAGSNNSFNCPVVSGYPEVIRSAINPEENFGIPFDKPVINFADEKVLKEQCLTYIEMLWGTQMTQITQIIADNTNENNEKISVNQCNPRYQRSIFNAAFEHANFIRKNYNLQFIENQQSILQECIENGELCFVVAGRPYHADPLVNQKVGQILSDLGVNVLTDDVFRTQMTRITQINADNTKLKISENQCNPTPPQPSPKGREFAAFQSSTKSEKYAVPPPLEGVRGRWANLNIVSQWSYPNRVLQTALETARLPQNIQMIQLNSFGCGPDSFFMEETGEILKAAGKNYTVLRIDEISSAGSIRLRCRSLIESLKAKNI
ncbi:MAG: acyl-CoA dehydratase activase-related protein [Prevotellaceae bacterium]|jgi:predicted nucleotide-binding protein (sugar kinase/HSP70/actin superfamily)|nr:acyl-CoA dehydratase activase-related protein [Prevotellaceae bacterium]